MKKLERMDGKLFESLETSALKNLQSIYGGAEEGAGTGKNDDTKVSDYCDKWGEKNDKDCEWDSSTQADRIKTSCENDTPRFIGQVPDDLSVATDTAFIDYASIV